MPITAAEIARMCNVSRTTVDRALKNKPGISPETRARIHAIAKEYDYHPNYLASSLSTGRTHSVGVIVFDLYNQHFSHLVNAIERYFSSLDVFTYICISNKDKRREQEIIHMLIDRQVDGIILIPINESKKFADSLISLNTPVVTFSNRLPGLPYVSGDNLSGAYKGTEWFYKHGFRTVYFVCPPLRYLGTQNLYAQEARAEGYMKFLKEHPDMQGSLITASNYLDFIVDLLRDSKERPGVFCSSDLFMLDIRKHLVSIGWNPDACCSLMGFDGLDLLHHLPEHPTTISYPAESIGEAAAMLLNNMIEGKETVQEILLPCPLIPGNTAD